MDDKIINLIEPTPTINSKKCKLISMLLKLFLQFTIYIVGIATFYIYDYFISIASMLLTFLIMGIIRSKLRNSVIPTLQREYNYNDKAIADWFTASVLCVETNDKD